MNKKTFRILEFDKIIEQLATHADSEPGRRLCLRLTPKSDPEKIGILQKQTADALARLLRNGSTSFGNNKDIAFITKHLSIGGSLNSEELLLLAGLLENVARVKHYNRSDRTEEFMDSLTEYFDGLEPLSNLSAEVRRCILGPDEFSDDASPTLKDIRRKINQTGDKIHSQLNSMVNGSLRTYLMDAVITMRNNRYCLPVKAEYKSQVPGMVHDQSSTGSTFFIEPASVVDLNNKLKELASAEKEEIEKILTNLSAEFMPYAETIGENARLMTRLDFIFAKGKLALEQNATEPVFSDKKIIRIRKGRHPLLNKKTVVPIDIHLGDGFEQLIITGPNTGGKTVSLKTVGLLTLMGQAGLHIPALDRSELRIFKKVFADIGDEQSIEQSLSTFSSHMTNIVSILREADSDSLCLFDELCSGTDPTEGAALAISILTRLHSQGIFTMATTHYSELKLYAISGDGVENASCEFDVETLSPTYRLLIGIPGKSNAFAISQKLGLSLDIIEKAKEQLSSEDKSFEDVLADLEKNRRTIEKEQIEIDTYKKEISALKEQLQKQQEKADAARERILKDANEEAREILQQAKDVADETIRNFHKYGSATPMKEMEKQRQKVGAEIAKKNAKLSIKPQSKPVGSLTAKDISTGQKVKVHSLGVEGYVVSMPDTKGNLFVQCGIIKSKVNIRDLSLSQEEDITVPARLKSQSSKIKMSKSLSVSTEINLLGMTCDEAISALDKYLDDAYVAHLPSVRIVHGKGTGALRKAVSDHLRRQSYIKSFRLGEFGEGDAGVTIAEFK
ncbi:MAG: endonuclease MutS2 [Lachnospiraceae bacterium]|nr:endonuclease MutS2 [Lachnospiraceae bacterium]